MVGATRFELATSRPPDVRATTAPSPVILIYDIGNKFNWRLPLETFRQFSSLSLDYK